MRRITVCIFAAAMAVLIVVPAWANSLTVNNAAAVDGNFGLQVTMQSGTTNRVYVRDDTPNAESTYRAQFWVDRTGGIFMDNDNGTKSTRFVAFRAADTNHNGTGTTVTAFRGIWGRLAKDSAAGDPRYTFRLGCRRNDGSFQYIGGMVVVNKKWVTVEFKAASAPGANDGICRLWSGNTKYSANLIGERTDISNGLHEIDFVQLGAIAGLEDNPQDGLTNGPLYFDSFESYRATLP